MAPHRIQLFENPLFNKRNLELALTTVGLILLLIGVSGAYFLVQSFSDRFYPGTVIDGQPVSGLTKTEVAVILEQLPPPPEYQVILSVESIQVASSSAELGLYRDYQPALEAAYTFDHAQPVSVKLGRVLGWLPQPHVKNSRWQYQAEAVDQALEILQAQVTTPAQEPTATLATSGKAATLTIEPGQAGQDLDITTAAGLVQAALATHTAPATQTIALDSALITSNPQLTDDQTTAARQRAELLVGHSLTLTGDDQKLSLNDKQLVSLLAFPDGYNATALDTILSDWQAAVSRAPQDAEFNYDPTTLTVSSFTPPQNGLHLDLEATRQTLETTLSAMETTPDQKVWTAELALAITPPAKTLADTNDLGIKEVIGFGESDYDHSIATRIYNVALTSSKITNYLLKPGAEFSFNQAVGDVSAATGFKPAYIIKDGQTILGDGGGVCQVSTTLFRAVLNAGLKVTKRRPHSYRVTYYELNQKPGFDATVYAGDVDLRFVNDTDHYVLIHTTADSKNLHMEVTLYGTSDGRTTEITGYQSWDARPAPPPVYTVDPTLAPGQVKQVDWAASGIKTKFTNVIKDKDGQVISEDLYTSNYVPWSAKYLTGP